MCCGGSMAIPCKTTAGPPPCTYPKGWSPPQPPQEARQDSKPPSCSGVVSHVGDTCCDERCGTCGGPDCDGRPGGAASCCGGSIRLLGRICNETTGPPCVYPEPLAGSRCTAGILDAEGKICCSKSCGRCGGIGCETRPGGGDECCGGAITRLCTSSAGAPPCRYISALAAPKPIEPVSAPSARRCVGGVESAAGDACCLQSCGQCGGPGCDQRDGGAPRCCGSSITTFCRGASGPPPCKYPPSLVGRHGEL